MFDELKKLAASNGDRLAVVSMERIRTLQSDLAEYDSGWMDFYRFDEIPEHMQSIIIVAVPRPAYAKVTWHLGGKEYRAFSGAAATTAGKTMDYITGAIQGAGYDINKEPRLPLKRIAAHSGLGYYGRNNIIYADGLGSALTLLAFSTNAPYDGDIWLEPTVSPICDGCEICQTLCPTSAIIEGRFRIDIDKCLTKLNQETGDFPDWVPHTAHHTTYYCLMCQARCPMNKGLEVIEMSFDEAETARILAGGSYDDAPDELKAKIARLTGFGRPEATARNLRVLFDVMDKGHVPKL